MKTTVKSLRVSKYQGAITGKVVITIADEVEAYIANTDEDGVITFEEGKSSHFSMAISALMAQLRNNSGDVAAYLSFYLDYIKGRSIEQRAALWSMLLNGAEININVSKVTNEDDDEEHEVFQYELKDIVLSEQATSIIKITYFKETMMLTVNEAKQMAELM